MSDSIEIKRNLIIPAHELDFQTSRSSGPGGQHANKSNTRVTVCWNIPSTKALSQHQINRVMVKLSSRLTQQGELQVSVETHRSQHQNKAEAMQRLGQIVYHALKVPKKRQKTKPTRASKRRRLEGKKQQSQKKKNRKKVRDY